MAHRRLLLAVLLYVTLDLSLAAMPGAFVFEPGDSVESVQGPRARGTVTLVAVAPASGEHASLPPAPPPSITPVSMAAVRLPRSPGVVSRLPRAALATALSEDPH